MFTVLLVAYQLTLHNQSPGLFCVFNSVLGALDAYDKGEFSGLVVDFEDQGLYYDPKVGPNWWSYYFEPISLGEKEPLKRFPHYKKTILSLTGSRELSLERARALMDKYVKIKPEILQKVDRIYQEKFAGSYVLGIHYRGTDKKIAASEVSYSEYVRKANEILKDKEHYKIFVATDDARFMSFMKLKFPTAFGLDALRSDNGKPVHIVNHEDNYRKGEEAVIDALLLARCDFLLKNSSNLSDWSRKYNPPIPYLELNTNFYSETGGGTPEYFSDFNTRLALYDKGGDETFEELPNYRRRIYSLKAQFEMDPKRAHELYTKYMNVPLEKKIEGPALGVYYHESKEKELQPPVPYETVWSAIEQQLHQMPADTRLYLVTRDKKFRQFLEGKHEVISGNGTDLNQALLLSQCDAFIRTCNTFSRSVSQLNPNLFCVNLDKNWQEKE